MLSTLCKKLVSVLIETYWNVKKEFEKMSENRVGINRNILECKDVENNQVYNQHTVLIETYWNVK